MRAASATGGGAGGASDGAQGKHRRARVYEKLGYVPDPDAPRTRRARPCTSAEAREYVLHRLKNKRWDTSSALILGNCFCPLTALTSLATFASRTTPSVAAS